MAFQGILTSAQINDDPQQQLRAWKTEKEFLVCIDTDGCVLDNMSAKQMLVFHPLFMDMNSLRGIETYYRLHAEHHNLWSKTRGCDRYVAIQLILGSLLEDALARDVIDVEWIGELKASVDGYVGWVNSTDGVSFGIPSLSEYHQEHGLDYNIARLLGWSEAVDRSFAFTTLKMDPFPNVREAIKYLAQRADILVVSGTPYSDLSQWWSNQDLTKYIRAIASKEMGKKDEHIRIIKHVGGYEDCKVIMCGDGGGDLKAVRNNDGLFFPAPAGRETAAWQDAPRVFEAFFAGAYRGSQLEKQKLDEFDNALLNTAPWEEPGYKHVEAYRKHQPLRVSLRDRYLPDGKLVVL